jgi:hypothetical protein
MESRPPMAKHSAGLLRLYVCGGYSQSCVRRATAKNEEVVTDCHFMRSHTEALGLTVSSAVGIVLFPQTWWPFPSRKQSTGAVELYAKLHILNGALGRRAASGDRLEVVNSACSASAARSVSSGGRGAICLRRYRAPREGGAAARRSE